MAIGKAAPDTSETAWYSTYSYYDKTWSWPKYLPLFDATGVLMSRQSDEVAKPGSQNYHTPVLARWTPTGGWEWQPTFAGTWQKLSGLGDEAADAAATTQGLLIGIGIIVIGFALLASGRRAA